MAKRNHNAQDLGIKDTNNKVTAHKIVVKPSSAGLSIPRIGSIWKHIKDGGLFTVVSTPINVIAQGFVTIECKESDEYTNKVDMYLDMFYSEFTLYKNNIPSKLESVSA